MMACQHMKVLDELLIPMALVVSLCIGTISDPQDAKASLLELKLTVSFWHRLYT